MNNDFLLEIGCEELPAKNLQKLSLQLRELLIQQFAKAQLQHADSYAFATPRRLAVLIKNLSAHQPNSQKEKRGPAINAPEQALTGFINSCNTTKDQLTQENNYWFYRYTDTGKPTAELLPEFIRTAIDQLSLPQSMRWGNHSFSFLRPVHWVTLLYSGNTIQTELFGKKTIGHTYGHHFLHPQKINLSQANEYAELLSEEGFVVADFAKRRQQIADHIKKLATKNNAVALINENLLDEVTGLVEWPVALWCEFPKHFLDIPREALITCMQHHQKCFALVNTKNELLPAFITISNIQSRDPQQVIHGNERVMCARLSDAKFFYDTDKTTKLIDRLPALKQVTFQQKLGSMFDKSERVATLAKEICNHLNVYMNTKFNKTLDADKAREAGRLCKTDLLTKMVNEFPELQGIMGSYYIEDKIIATAIREHYLPRFAEDGLPKTLMGSVLALADRIDTLVGIFGIGLVPTGDKDPFGLRRAALGTMSILFETGNSENIPYLFFQLGDFLNKAHDNYPSLNHDTTTLINFFLERLPAYYQKKNISIDKVRAILLSAPFKNNRFVENQLSFCEANRRIIMFNQFMQLNPNATPIVKINKRIANLLSKNNILDIEPNINKDDVFNKVNSSLLPNHQAKELLEKMSNTVKNIHGTDYTEWLNTLADFHELINSFLDNTMIEDANKDFRVNNLALLRGIYSVFLQVADFSQIQL